MQEVFEKIIERLYKNGVCSGNKESGFIPLKKAKEVIEQAAAEYSNGWVACSERLPKCEEEVFILTKIGTKTTAMYEDGKMTEEDSCWNWTDVDLIYDKETDKSYLPEGWWEYRRFNPDDIYNNCIDEEVIAWQPLPTPYQPRED